MAPRSRFLVLALLLVAAASSGCLWAPDLARMRRDLEAQVPGAHFRARVKLGLGPASLRMARWLTALTPRAAEANSYLHGLRHVELALYDTESLPGLGHLETPRQLQRLQEQEGWKTVVKVRQVHEAAWVLAREDADVIRELYVVALDADHLVMVHVEGEMEQLIARALENHPHQVPDCLGLGID